MTRNTRETRRNGDSRGDSRPYIGAWWEGTPVRLSRKHVVALLEAAGIDHAESPQRAKALITATAKVLGEHVEMSAELAKRPRPAAIETALNEGERLVNQLLDWLDGINVETRARVDLRPGDSSTRESLSRLRILRSRIWSAQRELEVSESRGAPVRYDRMETLTQLQAVFRSFCPDASREDLIDFLRAACAAAKPAAIKLPQRADKLLSLLSSRN